MSDTREKTSAAVAQRDMTPALRTRKAVVLQVVLLVGAVLLIWRLWPPEGVTATAGLQARSLLAAAGVGGMLMILLLAPLSAARATARRATFPVMPAGRAGTVAIARLGTGLAWSLPVLVTVAAVLALLPMLGGPSVGTLLGTLVLLAVSGVMLAAVGVLAGAFCADATRATVVASVVALLVVLAGVGAWPAVGQPTVGGGVGGAILHVIASLSPLQAMLAYTLPDSAYAVGASGLPGYWVLHVIGAIVVGLLATGLAALRLRRPVGGKPAPTAPPADWTGSLVAREMRHRPALQSGWLIRAFITALVIGVLLVFAINLAVRGLIDEAADPLEQMTAGVGALLVLAVVFIGPALAGSGIAREREAGAWKALAGTDVSVWRIVGAKLLGTILPLLVIVLAMAPAVGLLLYFRPSLWSNVAGMLGVVGLWILWVAAVGLLFSAIFRSSGSAVGWTYGVILALAAVTLVVLVDSAGVSERLARAVLLVNPLAAAFDAAGVQSMQGRAIYRAHLGIMAVLTLLALAVDWVRTSQLHRRAGANG